MKKDIYIIKNTINDKVYIGQSKDVHQRWLKHISFARKNPKYPLHKAMKKYGIDKFYYQILESQIVNYDDREKYWIQYYNCIIPNGYNIAVGGNSLGCGFENLKSIFDSEEEIFEVINYIENTNMTFQNIAKIFNCSEEVISAINLGKRYKIDTLEYPIRKTRHDKEKIKQILYSLKYELDKSLKDISKEYNVEYSIIEEINQGNLHNIPNINYPIREGKVCNPVYKYIDEIIFLLKNTNMQQKDIAKKFNVSVNIISGINKGRNYRKDNIDYPIRKNYQCSNGGRKCFSPNEIKEIEKELKDNSKSMRKIAQEYECGLTTILNINNGSIIKYRNKNIEYPIRKK